MLGFVVPIREIRVITPTWVISVGAQIVLLVVIHKIGIFLGRSFEEDHLEIFTGVPINFIYLTVESGGGNISNKSRRMGMECVMLKLSIFW